MGIRACSLAVFEIPERDELRIGEAGTRSPSLSKFVCCWGDESCLLYPEKPRAIFRGRKKKCLGEINVVISMLHFRFRQGQAAPRGKRRHGKVYRAGTGDKG